jgi:hypothetical protein
MSGTINQRYFIGEDARLRARFFLEDGVTPVAATGVRIMVRRPDNTAPQVYEGGDVLTDGVGSFFVDHRVTVTGRHRWRADCEGPTAGVDEGEFDGVRGAVL